MKDAPDEDRVVLNNLRNFYADCELDQFVAMYFTPWEEVSQRSWLHSHYDDKEIDEWVEALQPFTQNYALVLEARKKWLPENMSEALAETDFGEEAADLNALAQELIDTMPEEK